MAKAEGLGDQAILLQTFLGLGMTLGSLGFGGLAVSRSRQCMISSQYLLQVTPVVSLGKGTEYHSGLQAALLGIALSILALCSVRGYHGYLLFVWMYGFSLGGFQYVLKMFTFEK